MEFFLIFVQVLEFYRPEPILNLVVYQLIFLGLDRYYIFLLHINLNHQRLDFALLSMDQLVNNAAKWRFMFGGNRGVPLTVRMILGRGWGQGPTHSQNLQAWFPRK